MKIFKVVFISLIGLYILVLILAFTFQDKLIFFPQPLDKNYRYNLTGDDKEVFISTSDGNLINGILFHRAGNQNVVLYFHGNGGSLDSWQMISQQILPLKCDLLIIDYRGYGKSTGSFSEKGFYDDAHSAYRFLINSGYTPDQIIAYGRSLGTGIATELATTEKVKALIVESPYTSLADVAAEKMSWLLPKLLLRYRLNTLKRAGQLKVPVLVIHGAQDELIPCAHGQKIYAAISSPKKLLLIAGGGHNNLSDFKEHFEGVESFIDSLPK
jgi:fermentation-respiration switch protein FrsA (DUF1100 family)